MSIVLGGASGGGCLYNEMVSDLDAVHTSTPTQR